jgi:hypothetical protein
VSAFLHDTRTNVLNLRRRPNPDAHAASAERVRRVQRRGPLDWAHDTTYTDRREATIVASDIEWSLLLAVLDQHEAQGVQDLGADVRAQLRRQWGGPKP